METIPVQFDSKTTVLRFGGSLSNSEDWPINNRPVFILTDTNVFNAHKALIQSIHKAGLIMVPPEEASKSLQNVETICQKLVEMGADRKSLLIGMGGGMITDLAGFIASVYMRGIDLALIPTSLLAMTDAAIGGKNGVNLNKLKNTIGSFRQPGFIHFQPELLNTLPDLEWNNGFAEIIKHACIADRKKFDLLENHSPQFFRNNPEALLDLIKKNVLVKVGIVQQDEKESGLRKLLNFGHTFGHAIENNLNLAHGQAVAIGMVFACRLSEQINSFTETDRVINLLEKYGLPHSCRFNPTDIFQTLTGDKKKVGRRMDFILLKKIGEAVISPLALDALENQLQNCSWNQ